MGKVRIGTVEPNWEYANEISEFDARETLAFIKGAFDKYTDEKKDEYTDMNQDLCDYVRRMLSEEGGITLPDNDQGI